MIKIYRETILTFVLILVILQFFIGRWISSTTELRWIVLTFMLVYGFYLPSKKEKVKK